MAFVTPKTDWAAGNTPLHTDFNRAEGNTAVLGNLRTYPTATGTGTAIVVTTGYFELVAGRSFTFVAAADNSGVATTINADGTGVKNVYVAGTVTAPTFIKDKAYTVWYSGTSFFVKASAEGDADTGDVLDGKTFSNSVGTGLTGTLALTGDALAANVLAGKKFYKDDAKTQLTGTMPDKSGGSANNVTVSYANNEVAIPEGYYDGTETKAVLSLVTSGSNQVYTTGAVGTQSATYVTLASATVNYPGTYKITVTTSTNASYDDLGVKVNGQLKATADGTVTYDADLIKGMAFIVEGYIDSIFSATLTVDVTCYINEPAVFIG